jgi:hypothetical protein
MKPVLVDVALVLAEEYRKDLGGDHSVSIPELAEKLAAELLGEESERRRFVHLATEA